MTKTQTILHQQFPNWAWQFDEELASKTYFKIGGPAEAYIEIHDEQQLVDLVSYCRAHQIHFTLLGGASNVVVADEGIKGVVIRLMTDHMSQPEPGTIVAEAGAKTALVVSYSVAAGLKGLEYFLGVPGSLGGAIYNNAHYLRHLIGEHVTQVKILDEKNNVRWITAEECEFGYDFSRFHHTKEIILAAEFKLASGDKTVSQQLIAEATRHRAHSQPLGEASSGCIFQNALNTPELRAKFPQFAEQTHVSAGFLIEQAGLKGRKLGPIEVSQIHAAFLINKGGGTAAQVKEMVTTIKAEVKAAFSIDLHEEVFYLS